MIVERGEDGQKRWREREILGNRTDRTKRVLPLRVCIRACVCVCVLTRRDENAIDLSSIVLSDHVLRALISIQLSYLSFPRPVLSILSLLVAWNHRYADNHKWRAEKRGRNGERTGREGHRGGDKKGRGVRETAWFVVRMVLRYVTGNLVQFTITYYVTTTMRPTTNRAGKRGWPIESDDDYKRWYERERWDYVFVRISNGWQRRSKSRISVASMWHIYIYTFSSCDFSNCDSRRSSLRTQTRIRLFSFVLHGSSPSKRVPLWSLWATLRNPSSIIFWSRICSILERRGARCLEPTSRTWLESLVSLRLYGASKAGQGNGSVKMYGRAVPRFLVRWRQGWETGSGLVSPWHEIPRWETRNWWTPISMPELPFVAFRPCIIAFALNTPEFRTRIVGTEPH